MLETLRKPWVIIASFVVAIALVFAFQAWIPFVGGDILDQAASVDDQMTVLTAMSEDQKSSHFWMTLLLDYLFPLAYGSFFAGLALKFPNRIGVMLAIPAFLVFGADLVENTIQLMALKGNYSLLGVKAFLTPAKYFLFNVAALIGLMSLVWLAYKAVRSRLKRD
ncbi:hypothetical protein GCM10009069_16260 [Algimonas arctica]|uniref:Uncharacterized protein n=1 Tax=Algimonas arctica TaxID=1479486 RepID=A0A8J3CSB1_9PROT|nr:hypothetical protein [Algimonas arctica]GHA93906.1 hypothetical protein GCM10009069_16260 [Algimonas arctica]